MGDRSVQRRLAAVLAADVAGYTRLMEQDTDGTVSAWQDAREEVIRPQVGDHSGKIVKLTGDGFLVEFPTVQDAVNCAIAMQKGLITSPLNFRMGVNLGDIVDDGEDIHGEGINIAARIEALADSGGISISGDVYNQVRNRIVAAYEDRGEHQVKNVSAPVRVYAILANGGLATQPTSIAATDAGTTASISTTSQGQNWKNPLILLGVFVVAIAGGLIIWLQSAGKATVYTDLTIHGESSVTSEPFVFTIGENGRAVLKIMVNGTPREDIGKWWTDEGGLFCFRFTRFFARGQQRCVSPYELDGNLVSSPPRGVGKLWEFRKKIN